MFGIVQTTIALDCHKCIQVKDPKSCKEVETCREDSDDLTYSCAVRFNLNSNQIEIEIRLSTYGCHNFHFLREMHF